MKFQVIGESFKKYAPKDPEKMESYTDDKTFEDIYNELKKERDDLEFHKTTQEALDRCDGSKKGMSVDEFLKELDSW